MQTEGYLPRFPFPLESDGDYVSCLWLANSNILNIGMDKNTKWKYVTLDKDILWMPLGALQCIHCGDITLELRWVPAKPSLFFLST